MHVDVPRAHARHVAAPFTVCHQSVFGKPVLKHMDEMIIHIRICSYHSQSFPTSPSLHIRLLAVAPLYSSLPILQRVTSTLSQFGYKSSPFQLIMATQKVGLEEDYKSELAAFGLRIKARREAGSYSQL